jgi:hypothetical protein
MLDGLIVMRAKAFDQILIKSTNFRRTTPNPRSINVSGTHSGVAMEKPTRWRR